MKKWYVVNTYSGHENKVRATMERRIDSFGLKRYFGEISIPTESVVEIKDGKKVPTVQRQFPGYILVNMDMNDDTWRLVRQTPGVTQIVGAGDKPTPLSRAEVERLLRPGEVEAREKIKTTVDYSVGETVKVIAGPLMVVATINVSSNILSEAALSYLGVGVPLSTVTWGGMLNEGKQVFAVAWWNAAWPGLAILLAVFGTNLLGDGLSTE